MPAMRIRAIAFALTAAAGIGLAEPVFAASPKDINVVFRTLRYLPDIGRSKEAMMGVMFDPAVPASVEERDRLDAIIAAGIKGARIKAESLNIPVSELSAIDDVDFVYVTEGLAAHHGEIFAAASQKGRLTVSVDETCVDQGKCVMWVRAEPDVRIVVNRAAANATKLRFPTAFRMLVTER